MGVAGSARDDPAGGHGILERLAQTGSGLAQLALPRRGLLDQFRNAGQIGFEGGIVRVIGREIPGLFDRDVFARELFECGS